MFDFRDKKKNDSPAPSYPEQKKNSLDEINKDDLTVLEREQMNKVVGSKSVPVSFSDILTWSSSLGGTTPQ